MLLLVLQYQKMRGDQQALRQRIFEIVNFVNMVSQLHALATSDRKLPSSQRLPVQGLQAPENLHRPGGPGDLVHQRPDQHHSPSWGQLGRLHEVEEH